MPTSLKCTNFVNANLIFSIYNYAKSNFKQKFPDETHYKCTTCTYKDN